MGAKRREERIKTPYREVLEWGELVSRKKLLTLGNEFDLCASWFN